MNKTENNSNATPSLLGWDFQINAAIVLTMYNLKEVKTVRVEGKDEDIEIVLNDNSRIYSQVKHVENPDNYNTVLDHLKNALRTLNKASKNTDVKSLIYITNSPNPFSNQHTMSFFTGKTILKYCELPKICKDKVNKIIHEKNFNNLRVDDLSVYVIPFHGSNIINRYKEIRSVIEEKLINYKICNSATITRVLDVWQKYFFHNATTSNTSIHLSKQDLFWPIIVILMDENDAIRYKEDCNDDECKFVYNRYSDIINIQTINFSIVTKIIYDYNINKKSIMKFIDENWENYMDIVIQFTDDDFETKSRVVKIIMYKILANRESIGEVKKEVGL